MTESACAFARDRGKASIEEREEGSERASDRARASEKRRERREKVTGREREGERERASAHPREIIGSYNDGVGIVVQQK